MNADYAQAFDAGQRQAFTDRITGIRQDRPARLGCEADRGWWDGYTPRNAAWWVSQPNVGREYHHAVPPPPVREAARTLREMLNPPDGDAQRLLVAQREREAA